MRPGSTLATALAAAFAAAVLAAAPPAHAGPRYRVEPGETLEHVARLFGCDVDALLRANDLDTTLVPAGTVVRVPTCRRRPAPRPARARAADQAARAAAPVLPDDDAPAAAGPVDRDDEAQRDADDTTGARARAAARARARGVIDGAAMLADDPLRDASGAPLSAASLGEPWRGALRGAAALPAGVGYLIRRPARAFGAPHVIAYLRDAIAAVRALHPEVHTLAIGDLSAREGGKLSNHRSHQSGLDVDVGFYFDEEPDGYPEAFARADDHLDLAATWSLLMAFARTAARPDGVEVMFLDQGVQRRLYDWARAHGTRDDDLAYLFQFASGPGARAGLVRHEPGHADHVHVRFKPGR